MTQRMNPYNVAPEGVASLVGVEKYLEKSGLDHTLVLLLKIHASQINGCAYCLPHAYRGSAQARRIGNADLSA
jgi:AhpD family alkylhydroperoxidase